MTYQPDPLDNLRVLAGLKTKNIEQPAGINISITGTEKRRLEREHNIKPGTPEWFKLWFSLPYLTNEKPI